THRQMPVVRHPRPADDPRMRELTARDRATRMDPEMTLINDTDLEALRADLDGALALPGDDAYAETTTIWNGMITKRPAAVVRAASIDDVVRTVRFAASEGTELSIRGGGHNI